MKGIPAGPDGPSTSKPVWPNAFGCSATPAFFIARDVGGGQPPRMNPMVKTGQTVAQQIALAASAFEERLTGRSPRTVAVVLSGETLVITLHGALSPAERALAKTVEGAAEVQEYHRRLFASS